MQATGKAARRHDLLLDSLRASRPLSYPWPEPHSVIEVTPWSSATGRYNRTR